MQTNQLTLEEVKIKGLHILYENLGGIDFVRFLILQNIGRDR